MPDTAILSDTLPLPDGRILFGSTSAGHDQLAVLAPGKDAVPFLDTEEPTRIPASLVGTDRVAFLIGNDSSRRIAIASLVDGRILRRLTRPHAANVSALAGSPDGKSLFYVESGTVWAMPSEGGSPRKYTEGDQVAVDPTGQSLIIELTTRDAVRLVRVPVGGGRAGDSDAERCAVVHGALAKRQLWPRTGGFAVRIAPPDSRVLAPRPFSIRTQACSPSCPVRDLDMNKAAWGADGRLVSLALPERSSLWRFRPVTASR